MLQDHPRLRGNYGICLSSNLVGSGSPPLTRELRYMLIVQLGGFRITPAYAGTTPLFIAQNQNLQDHPRLRGNYSLCSDNFFPVRGSPPLTRELLNFIPSSFANLRITPAYAGTTQEKMGIQCSE